jgi:tRNA1(Val) A37 N6-methylase TrmN6
MIEIPFTEEYLLNNRVLLRQSKKDFRPAMESIFLAAAVQAQAGEIVLDINAGVGAASLCLAIRCPHVKVIGLETQREFVRYAADNIKANNLRGQVEILQGELLKSPPRLAAGTFSHVMVNPLFSDSHEASSIDSNAYLTQWIRFCLLMVRPKGSITLMTQVEYLDQMLTCFSGKLGDINLYPLWPTQNKAAKYILIRGIKNAMGPTCLQSGMILQHGSGQYSSAAEQIIHHAKGIEW